MRNEICVGLAALGLVAVAGCSNGNGMGTDTGAGGNVDTGVPPRDTGPLPDVGPLPDTGPLPDSGPQPATCQRPLFPAGAAWNLRADAMSVDGQSDAIIAALQAHGWGAGHMQIDYSIHVMCDADGSAPRMPFTQTGDFYSPDCDSAPVPIPAGGHLEGETGYDCTNDGDCHLIVIAPTEHRLYEQWRADFTGGTYNGGCLSVWDTSVVPPADGRGEGCTSADAGGFPIAAMLFDADEVAAGHIDHAIRFILPNNIIENNTYVHPATHATGHTSAPNSVPYGARLRIRDDRLAAVLAGLPNDAARVVAQAMHDYGMILSDGGNIALTAEDDERTTAKWDTVMGTGLSPRDLDTIQPSDFEMVEGGTRYDTSAQDCPHTPITS
jgi:hypothetical protein